MKEEKPSEEPVKEEKPSEEEPVKEEKPSEEPAKKKVLKESKSNNTKKSKS